jgi:hypothetical protein
MGINELETSIKETQQRYGLNWGTDSSFEMRILRKDAQHVEHE